MTEGAVGPDLRSAKVPRSRLAGPYGHPFHPIAVTIPIGAWSASVVFDIIGFAVADPAPYAVGSRLLIAVGLVGAVLAAVLGLMDMSRIARGTKAHRTAQVHLVLNSGAMTLFTVDLLLRVPDASRIPVLAFVLSLVAMAGLGLSGWLGGKLSYRWGVRVADESTQREGFTGV